MRRLPATLLLLASFAACSAGSAGGGLGDAGLSTSPGADASVLDPREEAGTSSGADATLVDGQTGGGPRILTFGANVTQITEAESVRFVAVVTHPGGLEKLVGGQLADASGAIKYGAFVADHQGTYSLDLSWAQMNQAQALTFTSAGASRLFRATFFDVAGTTVFQDATIALTCDGMNRAKPAACAGKCVDLSSDSGNCGACGTRCSASGSCAEAKCAGWTTCLTAIGQTCDAACGAAGKHCVSTCGGVCGHVWTDNVTCSTVSKEVITACSQVALPSGPFMNPGAFECCCL